MFRKYISLLLALCMIVPSVPAFASKKVKKILFSEDFSSYADNFESPVGVRLINGTDTRVVSDNGDKVLMSRAFGRGVSFGIDLEEDKSNITVMSADIKLTGTKTRGKFFTLKCGKTKLELLSFDATGKMTIPGGTVVGRVEYGKYMNIAIKADWEYGTYTVYVNGQAKISDWPFAVKERLSNPSSVQWDIWYAGSESRIFIDDIRVYSSSELLPDSYFQKTSVCRDVLEYTEITEIPVNDEVYLNSYGRGGFDAQQVSFNAKSNTVTEWKSFEDGGPECLHMTKDGTQDCYFEIELGVKQTLNFVYEVDIYIESLETSSLTLARIYDSNGHNGILSFSTAGEMWVCATSVGKVPFGKWMRLTVVCDYSNETADGYIDGKLICDDIPFPNSGIMPNIVRTQFSGSSSEGHNEIYINRIKAYEGPNLREFDDTAIKQPEKSKVSASIHETKEFCEEAIGSDVIFMTSNNFYYADGKKMQYPGAASYCTSGGKTMVPLDLFCEVMKIHPDESGLRQYTVSENGVTYIHATEYAKNILSKYTYSDGRGFVLISDTDRAYSNSEDSTANMESVDIVYGYMQYDRPTGDEIYSAIKNYSGNEYPRMFIRKNEIEDLKSKVMGNDELKDSLNSLIETCDAYIERMPTAYRNEDGLRIFMCCQDVKYILIDLGVAYLITGDVRYADRMWKEMENALNWQDWNVNMHFLDSGEIAPGMAFAYDVLHDYLTDEQKQFFRDKVDELYLDSCVKVFTGEHYINAKSGQLTYSNWGAVCSTAMLMMSLALIDEEPEDSELTKKCKYIAENSLRSLEYPMEILYPDGAVSDGVGYWEYFATHLSWSIESLLNMCGDDYGFLSSSGYGVLSDYQLFIQGPGGWYNYSSTSGEKRFFCSETYLVARHLGNAELMELLNSQRKNVGKTIDACAMLWYEPTDKKETGITYPLDYYFEGQDIQIMRSSWNSDNAAFLGAIVGKNVNIISDLDKGSFIYENEGVRWLVDMGKENNNLTGSGARYFAYRTRAEGHNCVVINPQATEYDQTLGGTGRVIRRESKEKGAITVVDLAGVYEGKVKRYRRGFFMGEDRNTLIVQDEIELSENGSQIYSFYHTRGNITINPDGKSAFIEESGKRLKVEFICNASDWKLEVRDAAPLFSQNEFGTMETSRAGYRKIALVCKASDKLNISVKFTPDDGNEYAKHVFMPMAKWKIEDGKLVEKPILDEMKMNGSAFEEFSPGRVNYLIKIPLNTNPPRFEASAKDGKVTVKQAENPEDSTDIIVQNQHGYKTVYRILYHPAPFASENMADGEIGIGLPGNVEFAPIQKVYASHVPQTNNPPESVIDSNFNTRWAADTSGAYIETDLGEAINISGVALSYMSGSERNYIFRLSVSEDGENYTDIYDGLSTGETDEYEYVAANVKARYIRYTGFGHKNGEWNSVTEIRPCIKSNKKG